MNKPVGALALVLLLTLAWAGSALAADAAEATTCSKATLQGTYLFAHDGLTVTAR